MLEDWIKNSKKIAANPSTPPHVLIELSKHRNSQIRSLIASNPNTPLETLKCLGWEFADAIVENPVFDLLKLEDPYSNIVRLTLARSTKTPPEVLVKLIATEKLDVQTCRAVANNINTPIDALGNLAIEIANGTIGNLCLTQTSTGSNDWDNWLHMLEDIISNPNISESCLEKILDISIDRNHQDLVEEFLGIFNISNLSYRMLEKLSLYPTRYQDIPDIQIHGCGYLLIDLPTVNKSPIILDNIARNTNTFRSKDDVFLKIANNPITLTRTIEYIAAHNSPHVRNALIDHPNVSRKALDIILFMQGKPGTSVELLHELAHNLRLRVLEELATYPDVPSEVLDIVSNNLPPMFIHGSYRWIVMTYLAYHPNSSNNLLQKIVKELKQVGSFISSQKDDGLYQHYEGHIDREEVLQKINKLTKKIVRRLKGEHLSETDKICADWAIATEKETIEDRYSWENLYQPDSQARN